jgi:hypothetical protein
MGTIASPWRYNTAFDFELLHVTAGGRHKSFYEKSGIGRATTASVANSKAPPGRPRKDDITSCDILLPESSLFDILLS